MQASSTKTMVRVLLALLTLCGSVPGAVTDLTTGGQLPGGAGVRKGGDGVGGIDKEARRRKLPSATAVGQQSSGTPPMAQTGEGAFGPWTNLGAALAPGAYMPHLLGSGSAIASTSIGLQLAGAPANGSAMLIIGAETADIPFHGGLLVPRPDLIVTGLPLDEDGQLMLSTVLPANTPPGLILYMQMWVPDATSPTGWAATNALKLITS
ncbi:MAG: hypothetical protein ACYTCU_01150 [Planctomycetota bacterium]|jgi:hypothetical protein